MATYENEIVVITKEIPQGEEEQNHFNRLPDELIVSHILGKIPEAKTLFSCYLLSKRFACLVLQSQTISCTIFGIPGGVPSHAPTSTATFQSLSMPRKLLHSLKRVNPFRFLSGLSQKSRPSSSSSDKSITLLLQLVRFIMKFRSLEFLYVEVEFSGSHKMLKTPSSLITEGGLDSPKFPTGPIFKWKAESKPENSGGFILFHARSAASLGPAVCHNEEEENDQKVVVLAGREMEKEMCILEEVSEDARSMLTMFGTFAPVLPARIQSIVITDPMKQGKAVLGKAKLAELRSGTNMAGNKSDPKLKLWYAKVVRLPSTGCVMKEVSIFTITWGALNDDEDVESIAKNAFEGEEEVFGEAATEMLKKPACLDEYIASSMI